LIRFGFTHWWHFHGLDASLDHQAALALTHTESIMEESSFILATKATAETVQVELTLEGGHAVGGEVFGHDLFHKLLNLVNGETETTRVEGDNVIITIQGGFMEDAVELERERLILVDLLHMFLRVETEKLVIIEIRVDQVAFGGCVFMAKRWAGTDGIDRSHMSRHLAVHPGIRHAGSRGQVR